MIERRMRYLFAIPAVLLLAVTLRAGTIVTIDGETYTGDIKKTDDGYTITQTDGQVKTVPQRLVKTLKLEGDSAKAGSAIAGLKSLRRSVEFSDDLPRIVQRYQQFISQSKDPEVTEQAQQDLAVWVDRANRGLVKFGHDWTSPAERNARIRDLRNQAEQARLLIKDRRDHDAETAITTILQQDPTNVSALYLRGVLAQKKPDNGEAKKAFQAVQQSLPQHAPTLLNLALVQARQKQWAAGCVAFESALQAAPVTQVLLDTAAEFLNAVPPEVRRGAAAQKLQRTFLDQDTRMQQLMAVKHLYRWGASWIDQPTYDDIRKDNDAVQKKVNDLQKQFDTAQERLTNIDKQVADNQRAMREMELHSYASMPDGTTVRVPLPTSYYDLQSSNNALEKEKTEVGTTVDTLRAAAKDVNKGLRTPTYTGSLQPIDEDGVPLAVLPDDPAPAAPAAAAPTQTTAPSTAPSTVIRIGPAATSVR